VNVEKGRCGKMKRNLYLEACQIFNSRRVESIERVEPESLHQFRPPVEYLENEIKNNLSHRIGRLISEELPLNKTKYSSLTEYSISGYFLTREDVEKILRLLDEALVDKNLSIAENNQTYFKEMLDQVED